MFLILGSSIDKLYGKKIENHCYLLIIYVIIEVFVIGIVFLYFEF